MFICCLIINGGRTAVFDSGTSDFFFSFHIASKCIVTGDLLNMENCTSVFFLYDTYLSFNFTKVYYKLCFNGAGVLINPDWSLWQVLFSPLLVFHITYLLVSDCLSHDVCHISPDHLYRFCNKTATNLHRNVYLCSLSMMFIFHLSKGRP